MTSLVLEPAYAGGTPDLIRGLVVEATPKRMKRARKVEADEPDLIGAK
jgi:hypothetical protein